MKRFVVLITVALVLVAGLSAQDLSGLGRDFEVLIEELGGEILPSMQQTAIWGQYTGSASFAESSNFIMTVSLGSLLTDGILSFVDTGDFGVLNVTNLFEGIISQVGNENVTNLVTGAKTFFPFPIARTSVGFTLPGDYEVMVGAGGFPGFIAGWAGGLAGADSLKLSMLHLGTKVRKEILDDAGPFPSISIGAGYSYSGMTFGYDLGAIGSSGTEYGQISAGSLGTLNVKGELLVRSRVHTFGFDLHASKRFGVFVPYLGLSPYFHIASFGGNVGTADTFEAYLDYGDGDPVQDVVYTGDHPETALVQDDLSLLVFGGFEFVFSGSALQISASWLVPAGSPGVALNFRFQ